MTKNWINNMAERFYFEGYSTLFEKFLWLRALVTIKYRLSIKTKKEYTPTSDAGDNIQKLVA